VRHNLENSAGGVARAIGFVHYGFHALLGFGVDATEQDFRFPMQRHDLIPRGLPAQTFVPDGDHVPADLDAEPPSAFGQGAPMAPGRALDRAAQM
jgi:hypothetical protein